MKIDKITNKEYHARSEVSCSNVKAMLKSMKHGLNSMTSESKQTPAMLQGTVVHSLVLEPETFIDEYAIKESIPKKPTSAQLNAKKITATTASQINAYNSWLQENGDKTIITKEQFDIAKNIDMSIKSHKLANELLSGGSAEESFISEIKGVPVKARADYIKGNHIIDLKTASDASPEGFLKAVLNFRYDIQTAFYLDVIQAERFTFVVCETSAPYAVGVYELEPKWVEYARNVYKNTLADWKGCVEMEHFTGYVNSVLSLEMPRWFQ